MALQRVTRATLRALLRAVPLVPGPELFDLIQELRQSRTSIDAKVQKALASVQEAATLFDEIEATLKERSERLEELRAEVQRYSKLAEIEEGEAAALVKQLESTLNRGRNAERWISFGINIIAGIIFFVLGAWLGPKVTAYLQRLIEQTVPVFQNADPERPKSDAAPEHVPSSAQPSQPGARPEPESAR